MTHDELVLKLSDLQHQHVETILERDRLKNSLLLEQQAHNKTLERCNQLLKDVERWQANESTTRKERDEARDKLRHAEDRILKLRKAAARENDDVCQVLGKGLDYPWFKDDPENFPGATADDGVCVGDHTGATLAAEAIKRLHSAYEQISKFSRGESEERLWKQVRERQRDEARVVRSELEAEVEKLQNLLATTKAELSKSRECTREEKRLRKEQNTKLLGRYLSAMRAVNQLLVVFGGLGGEDEAVNRALAMGTAEVELYLTQIAPTVGGEK